MAVGSETFYLITAGVLIIIIIIVKLANALYSSPKKEENPAARRAAAPALREDVPVGARRRLRRRMNVARDSDEEDEEEPFESINLKDEKMGTKKLRKLQEKEEKRAMREQVEREREEKKEREAMKELKQQKDDEKRKAEEAAKIEEKQRKKEEEEKRQQEEYLKMKVDFTVEEEGEDEAEVDLGSGSLLQEFINYIKDLKIVMLEDLAAHFNLKTQIVIDHVEELQKSGDLTGVIDDRGKFIYITMDELQSVAKYICQHGRVSISELVDSSNKLIILDSNTLQQHVEVSS